MTYYGAKELAESFRTVRKNTIQVAEDIPADVRDDIRGHPIAEHWGELAALSKLAPADQQRAARVAAIDADHRLTRVSDLLAAVTPDGELLDTLPEPAPKPPTKRAQIEDLLIAAVAGQIMGYLGGWPHLYVPPAGRGPLA